MLREGCEPRCPGCAHRSLSAQDSQTQKQGWLERRLAPWAEAIVPLRAVAGEDRWHYRDKLCLSAVWRDDRWRFGLMSRDELIEIPHCPVHSRRSLKVISLLAELLPPEPVFPMAFYVQSGSQLTLVLKTDLMPALDWLDEALREGLADAGIVGLWLHLNRSAGRRLFTKNDWRRLWGEPRSQDGSGLWYGPAAFQQLLPELYALSLAEAEDFLVPGPDDAVVDLYCGIGASLRRWTARGARAVGVELAGEAVECAQCNAPAALILRGQCRTRIPQIKEWRQGLPSIGRRLLYVNPPRTGVEPEVLNWVTDDFRPQRMAYLSCSAGTLARDLEVLDRSGYRVARITPYDFFPQTYHVETLALLARRV